VLVGVAEYPSNVFEYIQAKAPNTVVVDAMDIAVKCGNPKAANVVLLGVMARNLPIEREVWEKALAERVPAKFLEVNKAAFTAGYEL